MCTPFIVYVVDDDESVRRAFNRLLASAGWQVETYASGAAFLDAYSTSQPGCVVLLEVLCNLGDELGVVGSFLVEPEDCRPA